jgi:hypothetical protein
MEVCDWIKASRPSHLTLGAVPKPGETIQVLCLDRNWQDLVLIDKTTIPKNPERFFAAAYHLSLTRKDSDSLLMSAKFWCDAPGMHNDFNDDEDVFDFEFHVEYKPDHWFPFQGGILAGVEGLPEWNIPSPVPASIRGKKWNEFPPETRIGWRGPAIDMRNLATMPDVYEAA